MPDIFDKIANMEQLANEAESLTGSILVAVNGLEFENWNLKNERAEILRDLEFAFEALHSHEDSMTDQSLNFALGHIDTCIHKLKV